MSATKQSKPVPEDSAIAGDEKVPEEVSGEEGDEQGFEGDENEGEDPGSEEEDAWRATETHQDASSVFPVCVDPESRVAYVLMGGMCLGCKPKDEKDLESTTVHLPNGKTRPRLVRCQFHGWVDVGENLKEAAAREAQEEGLGILGSRESILALLNNPSTHHHVLLSAGDGRFSRSGIYMISLGLLSESQRGGLVKEFNLRRRDARSQCMHFGMQEMIDVSFIRLDHLREAVLSGDVQNYSKVDGMGPDEWLRAMLRRRLADAETWDRLTQLIDGGVLPCEGQWYLANATAAPATSSTASSTTTTTTTTDSAIVTITAPTTTDSATVTITTTTTTTTAVTTPGTVAAALLPETKPKGADEGTANTKERTSSTNAAVDTSVVRLEPMSLEDLLRPLELKKQLCRHWHHHASCQTPCCPFSHPPRNSNGSNRGRGKGERGGRNSNERDRRSEGKEGRRRSSIPALEDSEPSGQVGSFSGRGGRRGSVNKGDPRSDSGKTQDGRGNRDRKPSENSREDGARQWRGQREDEQVQRGENGRREYQRRDGEERTSRGNGERRDTDRNRGGRGGYPRGRSDRGDEGGRPEQRGDRRTERTERADDRERGANQNRSDGRSRDENGESSNQRTQVRGGRPAARGGGDMDEWLRLRQQA